MINKAFIYIAVLLFSFSLLAESNIDQWKDSDKTYFDLIQEGYEVKGYDMSNINSNNGFIFMLFVTVLQKDKQVYECQEYQTVDSNLQTLDMAFVCRKLIQPYQKGLGT